jgi:hypothetical protein
VRCNVLAGPEPAHVAADEVLPRVGERGIRGFDVAGHVLGELALANRRPARVDYVDEHQRVVVGEMDEDVVGRVVGAVPGQLDAFASDLEGAAVLEGLFWWGPGGVVVAEQQFPRLLVPDASDVPAKQRRRAGVIGVVMGIDEMRHLVADAMGGGDLIHGPLDVVTDARRRVEQDDAVGCRQERALVGPVRDPVEVRLDSPDVVPLLVDRGAERRPGDRRTVRKPAGGARARVGCAHRVLGLASLHRHGIVALMPGRSNP